MSKKIRMNVEILETRGKAYRVKIEDLPRAVFVPQSKVKDGVLSCTKNQAMEKLADAALPEGYWMARDGKMCRVYFGDDYIQCKYRFVTRGTDSYYDRHRIAKGDDGDWTEDYSFSGDQAELEAALVKATGSDNIGQALHGVFVNHCMNPKFTKAADRLTVDHTV